MPQIPYEDGKVCTASEMARVERRAILDKASRDEEFMMNAALGIFEATLSFISDRNYSKHLYMLCGKGNNAGDAYATGEMFIRREEMQVTAYQLFPLNECSELCQKHAKAFAKAGGEIILLDRLLDMELNEECVVLDGLLGTGFKGSVEGLMAEVITFVNQCPNPIIAIDIPSGVPGDTGVVKSPAIKADLTICLGTVKVGHLYNQGLEHSAELYRVDFGMPEAYMNEIEAFGYLVNPDVIKYNYPCHKRTANKYEVGKVVIVGGSQDMPGAPILACKGSLRSGAGIVHLFHPPGMSSEFSGLPPEILRSEIDLTHLDRFTDEMARTKALLVGPGLGRGAHIPKLLETIYQLAKCPLVLDADALYFFKRSSGNPTILTPHRGELLRLLQTEKSISDIDLINQAESFAKKHNVVIVCKGAPTTLVFPNRSKLIVIHGNVGMASGGVGDVLAGIITAILAQGKSVEEAAILGTTLHALAGDLARDTKSTPAMIATDIIDSLPTLFLRD